MIHLGRVCGRVLAVLTLAVGAVTGATAVGAVTGGTPVRAAITVAGPRLLDDTLAMYPRAIRLQHSGGGYDGRILVSVNSGRDQDGDGTADYPTDEAVFYESTDNGGSFVRISTLDVPDTVNGRWSGQGTIFEFPQALGGSPAGTLVWAVAVADPVSVHRDGAQIRLWKSPDHGRSWQYLSDCADAGAAGNGLWEPELSVDSTGALVCHYSDKSQPAYGQALAAARSHDGGVTWTERENTVAVDAATSPGMATVRRLPNGTYLMSYELCDVPGKPVIYGCQVRLRTSPDGWNWGDPKNIGTQAMTEDGRQLSHAPTIAVSSTGRILLIAKYIHGSAEDPIAGSGQVMLANDQNGTGTWYEVAAPARVGGFAKLGTASDAEHFCKNYSPALLPSADGAQVFEVTTDLVGDRCTAYFGTGWATSPPLRLMALGDSITEGYGGADGRGYRGDLWQLLAADGRQVDFVGSNPNKEPADDRLPDPDHEGFGGYRTTDLLGILQTAKPLEKYRPSHVLLHIGTNDLNAPNPSVTGALAGLRSLVEKITATLPTSHVYIAKIIPYRGGQNRAAVDAYNKGVADLVAGWVTGGKLVHLVDMSTALTDSDMADALHPNDSGYSKMAARWYEALNSTLLFRWEAEDPATTTLNSAERITIGTNASGGGKVGHIDYPDSYLQYSVGAPYTGTYRMFVRAGNSTGSQCSHTLTVNGVIVGQVAYPSYGWDRWSMTAVDVPLNAGANTIRLAKADCYAEIDSIDFAVGPREDIYQVVGEAGHLCVDVARTGQTSSTPLVQRICTRQDSQAWLLTPLGANYFTLRNSSSGKCATATGGQLQLTGCNTGDDAQKWLITKAGPNPGATDYTLRSKPTGFCAQVANGSSTAGARIEVGPCDAARTQTWNLTPRVGPPL